MAATSRSALAYSRVTAIVPPAAKAESHPEASRLKGEAPRLSMLGAVHAARLVPAAAAELGHLRGGLDSKVKHQREKQSMLLE